MTTIPPYKFIVLFDGYCNLCNGAVQFIIERDKRDLFRYASLSWPVASQILSDRPELSNMDSILVYTGEKVLTQSSAALFIAARLSGLWPLMRVFWIIPKFIRDGVYNWVARNRYRWFGKKDACMLPSPELKSKFLEG